MNGGMKAAKRAFDIVLASLFLILFSPLFILFGILIKLEGEGQIFFKHTRSGLNEKPFKMWKFRTMVNNADKIGPGLTAAKDPRITRIGGLLRRTSLDELPQLINVLKGEMSIVGPRPEIPEIVATYSKEQKRALTIKPGITGLSQVNGRDDLPVDVKVGYDIKYVDELSPVLDLKILLKTLPAVMSGRGNRC